MIDCVTMAGKMVAAADAWLSLELESVKLKGTELEDLQTCKLEIVLALFHVRRAFILSKAYTPKAAKVAEAVDNVGEGI